MTAFDVAALRRASRPCRSSRTAADRLLRRPRRHPGPGQRSSTPSLATTASRTPTPTAPFLTSQRSDAIVAEAHQAMADMLGAGRSRRDQVRPEHDDADVPPQPIDHGDDGARATRSSSRGSTTTATSIRGWAPRATAASRSGSGSRGSTTARSTSRTSTRCSARGRSSSRSAGRRTRSARSTRSPRSSAAPTRRAPGRTSTRSTPRRTCRSTSGRSTRTSSPARRTSSSARTSASCTARRAILDALPTYKLGPPTTGSRPARRTTRASPGVVAAVEYLAEVGRRTARPRPPDVARRRGSTRR